LSSHPRCTSDEALRQLADDVYYSSLMVGRKHIDTSGGYFQLGNVFYSMNKVENALAMYDKVVDIWYKCVTQLLSTDAAHYELPALGDAKGAEGVEVLRHIAAGGVLTLVPCLVWQVLRHIHKRREECHHHFFLGTLARPNRLQRAGEPRRRHRLVLDLPGGGLGGGGPPPQGPSPISMGPRPRAESAARAVGR